MLASFEQAYVQFCAGQPANRSEDNETIPQSCFEKAFEEITSWDGYEPTPLIELDGLAKTLNVANVYYKDESLRFGLGSFKALGGAYAVLCVLQRELSARLGRRVSFEEIHRGDLQKFASDITVITATDGNHGRSVAWGAKRFGVRCRIYIHAEVREFRAEAMRQLGAEVIRIDGDYDASVAVTRAEANRHGWKIVSDTSWPGYFQAPTDVMSGYGVMAHEIVRGIDKPPTHLFLQGGVGGLAASLIAVFQQAWQHNTPRSIIVEPELAPCLFESAKKGEPTAVQVQQETLMAGLSCGEPSVIAWEVLAHSAHAFMTIPDSLVAPTVRMLAQEKTGDTSISAGESAVAGLIGCLCAALQPYLREKILLGPDSRILLIGSEGVTDPGLFLDILAEQV